MALSGRQSVRGRPALTTACVLAATLAVLTAGLGYVDGTGLFAPENWVDAGAFPGFATSPAWATVTYLPILVVGSAAGCYVTVRAARPGTRARWVLTAAWSSVVLTAFVAKVAYTVLLLVVAGAGGLRFALTVAAVLAECGLCGAKYAFLGVLAAAPAALAYWIRTRRGAGAVADSRLEAGGINLYSCVTGKDLPSPAFQTTALDQAYPRGIPGRLSTLTSSPTGVNLSLAGSGTGVLDVWIPGTSKPTGNWTGLRGVTLSPQPGGGWRLTGSAAGAYSLRLR